MLDTLEHILLAYYASNFLAIKTESSNKSYQLEFFVGPVLAERCGWGSTKPMGSAQSQSVQQRRCRPGVWSSQNHNQRRHVNEPHHCRLGTREVRWLFKLEREWRDRYEGETRSDCEDQHLDSIPRNDEEWKRLVRNGR